MSEQLIIAISREFGSGGHEIAERLSEIFKLPLYDYNLLREISTEKNLEFSKLEKYDELPKSKIFSRNVRGHSNSPEENIAKLQFKYLKKKAREGQSFVIVGRCAETVLKEYTGMIPIFILADMDYKVNRTKKLYQISESKAKALIARTDKKRRDYHNYHCTEKWGDASIYDICINSGRLGVDKTVEVLANYIKERMNWSSH